MRIILALTAAAAIAGCSGDNGIQVSDGGKDANASDLAMSIDFATVPIVDLASTADFSGINCGPQTCTAGMMCCANQNGAMLDYTCATSCADAGITLACDGPDNCSSGTPFCCAQAHLGPGNVPNCPITGVSSCTATCPISLPSSCDSDGRFVLCHRKSDCAADPSNGNCCLFTFNGNSINLCVNNIYKAGSASCAP